MKYNLKIMFLAVINFFVICKLKSEDKVGFIFAPGFCGTKEQIKRYNVDNYNQWRLIEPPASYLSFNFCEINNDNTINTRNANFAQERDINLFKEAYQEFYSNKDIDKIVLIGVSRGAAAVINFAATRPEKLAALVLESPFDSLENVISFQLDRKYVGWWSPGLKLIIPWTINKLFFPTYNSNSLKPINEIVKIDKNCPIIIIHSKQDKLISLSSSRALYRKLKENAFKHAYLLELETGEHVHYQSGPDAIKYQAAVHAFYAKYNIPHNKQLALNGKKFLFESQRD